MTGRGSMARRLKLSPFEARVLSAISDEPQSSSAIAARLTNARPSDIASVLARLCVLGLVECSTHLRYSRKALDNP